MTLTLPKIPETDEIDYKLYLSQKEIEFWQSVSMLPVGIKEGNMVLGGKLVITRPIKLQR